MHLVDISGHLNMHSVYSGHLNMHSADINGHLKNNGEIIIAIIDTGHLNMHLVDSYQFTPYYIDSWI